MPTEHKRNIVVNLVAKLRRAKALVLMQTQGLSVADQTQLRKKLRGDGLEFAVVKNTLFRLAIKDAEAADLDEILRGPTAVAFGYDDESTVAKSIVDYVRTSKIVTIKAGALGRLPRTAQQVEDLAKLPGRDQLRSQAVGAIGGPAQQTYSLLSAPMRDLVQILHNYAEKQGASFE